MKQTLTAMMTAISISTVTLTAFVASVYVVVPAPVLANPGNGGGNGGGGGKGGGNGGGNGAGHSSSAASSTGGEKAGAATSGSIHAELKGLNAAHASLTAMAHASPNSQVGRIAAYRTAALETKAQAETLALAQAAYNAYFGTYTGPTEAQLQAQIDAANAANAQLQTQIDSLDPTSTTYAAEKATLEAQMTDTSSLTTQLQAAMTYETQLAALQQEVVVEQTAYNADVVAEQSNLSTASNGRTLSDGALAELRRELGL